MGESTQTFGLSRFYLRKSNWVNCFLLEFMLFRGRLCATIKGVAEELDLTVELFGATEQVPFFVDVASVHMNPDPHPPQSESASHVEATCEGEDDLSVDNATVLQANSRAENPETQCNLGVDKKMTLQDSRFPEPTTGAIASSDKRGFGVINSGDSIRSPLDETREHPILSPSDPVLKGSSETSAGAGPDPEPLVSTNRNSERLSRRQDPLTQSLFLLATMAVLLLAARYAVPRIVEEIRYGWHRGELRAEYESGTEGLRNVSLDTLSRAYQMVTSAVGPSVVHIDVKQKPTVEDIKIQGHVFPLYAPQTDQGSGVVVSEDGYLLTNRHVIADGEDIYVTLGDGRRMKAVVVGTDRQTDLAVLKVETEGLIPITWGDSDRCRVGSPVWAVGSPFGLDQTVTFGILSGKHRLVEDSTHYQDFMQSDVAVNPGNSGGPLVDARGALIGINTAIVGESYQGVSFAVPSNVAKQVYEGLREDGRVDRGWLGVRLSDVEDDKLVGTNYRVRGAIVSGLTNEFSPAAVAGLKLDDHILTVDSKPVRDLPHLMRLIGSSVAGSNITLAVVRAGEPLQVTVVLGSRPDVLNQP